jgi:uncharacterized protein YozE (UPF0346 family)
MNKNKLIIILLPVLLTVSCNSRNTVYFFSDKYFPELKIDINIIEELEKTADIEKYNLKTYITDSEENFITLFNRLNTISENDRIVMTSFVYNNYFSGNNNSAAGKIYIIGPYSGFDRAEITIEGNWESVFEDTAFEIRAGRDFNHIYFYCEKEQKDRFPIKDFAEKLKLSRSEGNNPLSVTIMDFDEISDQYQGSNSSKDLVVVFPGWDGAEFINMISSIKSSYILVDYADISELDLISAAKTPLSVIKYDYKTSFETVLRRKDKFYDNKVIYISTFEKK